MDRTGEQPLADRRTATRPWINILVPRVHLLAGLATMAMIAGLFGRWHFLPDLASHFRIQATMTLLAAGVLLWLFKRRRSSAASLLVGSLLGLSLTPFL